MKIIKNTQIKIFSKLLLCCMLLAMVLIITACDEYTENATQEYPIECEYSTETELPLGEPDADPFDGMFEVWADTTQKLGVDFIERSVDDIERIIVFINPFAGETFYITERSEIERLYSILAETIVTFVNENPTKRKAITGDVEFMLHLEYSDGDYDEILSHPLSNWAGEAVIVRMLDTVGYIEDLRFILGVNEEIWEFIAKL